MRPILLAICVTVTIMMLGATIEAQERDPIDLSALGPQIGERVPDFSLPDQHGRIQTLESIMGEKGAMILFHRSADW